MAISISDIKECVYSVADGRVMDVINPNTGKGLYGGKEVYELMQEQSGLARGSLDDAVTASENHWRRGPSYTTQEKFEEMLKVLPPMGWRFSSYEESFKMSELTSGRMTAIYARVGNEYFSMCDNCTLSHDAIIKKCREFSSAR